MMAKLSPALRLPVATRSNHAADRQDLLDQAERLLGIEDTRSWYQETRLAEFQYLTPSDLVRAGRASELTGYLERHFGLD